MDEGRVLEFIDQQILVSGADLFIDERGVRFLHHGSQQARGIGDEDLIVLVPVIAVVQGKVVDNPEEVQRLEQLETGGVAPQVPVLDLDRFAQEWQQTTFSQVHDLLPVFRLFRGPGFRILRGSKGSFGCRDGIGISRVLQTIQVARDSAFAKAEIIHLQSGITDHVDRFAADLLQRFFEGFPKRSQVVVKVVNSLPVQYPGVPLVVTKELFGHHEEVLFDVPATIGFDLVQDQLFEPSRQLFIFAGFPQQAVHDLLADILFVEVDLQSKGQVDLACQGTQQPLKKTVNGADRERTVIVQDQLEC